MKFRDTIKREARALRCTPLMRVLHFGSFRNRYEKVRGPSGAKNLCNAYLEKLEITDKDSEKPTPGWSDMACTFLKRVWPVARCRKVLLEAEDLPEGTNPLEGTSKMQSLIGKASNADNIGHVMEMLLDRRKAGYLAVALPLVLFQGTAPGCGGKGIVELLLMSRDLADNLMTVWGPLHKIDPLHLIVMRELFLSCASYRAKCGYPLQGDQDMTFRAGWNKSSEALYTLVESLLFDVIYDNHIKKGLKAGGDAATMLQAEFSEDLKRIEELLSEEAVEEAAQNAEVAEELPGDAQDVDASDDDNTDEPAAKKRRSEASRPGPGAGGPDTGAGLESADASNDTPAKKNALKLYKTHISFLADKGGPNQLLAQKIAETQAGKYIVAEHGQTGKGYVACCFDTANFSLSTSHPHLRKPCLNSSSINRPVDAGNMARSIAHTGVADYDKLQDDTLWFLWDGGRCINSTLMKAFKASGGGVLEKSKQIVHITYEEDALLANVGRACSVGGIKRKEQLYVISATDIKLPRRMHAHYKGSNYSDSIDDVKVAKWDDETTWKLPHKQKKEIFDRFLADPGSTGETIAVINDKNWKKATEEPVFFHAKPFLLLDALAHGFFIRSIVDFTPCDGQLALVACKYRIPYCGITCSDKHSKALEELTIARLEEALEHPDDIGSWMSTPKPDKQAAVDKNKPGEKPAGKAKKAAKGKAKSAGKAKAAGKEALLNKLAGMFTEESGPVQVVAYPNCVCCCRRCCRCCCCSCCSCCSC